MENFKVVLIGSLKVGKTSLVNVTSNKYFSNQHWPTKNMVETQIKISLPSQQTDVDLRVCDLCGNE